MRNFLIRAAITVFIAAAFDFALLVLNPDGFMRYQADTRHFLDDAVTTSQATDYTLLPGRHYFSDWTLTVNADGTRWVPASDIESERSIAFIGDSVTMGWGVDDYNAWVNLVARELSGWRVVNAGTSGFDSRNIRLTQEVIDADIYIYYIIDNDHERNTPGIGYLPSWQPATLRYLRYIFHDAGDAVNYVSFDSDIKTLAAREVYFVGHGELLKRVAARYPAQSFEIEQWTSIISGADGHADLRGNQEIAAQMIEVIKIIRGNDDKN
jgi:hypothetical protein